MKNSFFTSFKYFLLGMLTLCIPVSADETADTSVVAPARLLNHVPTQAISQASFLGTLDTDAHVPVTFTLPLRNQEELEKLLTRLYDPADELYGKFLTQTEFIEQFAPTQEDYDKVIAYANSRGMHVIDTYPNRTLLKVGGPTETVQAAFNVQLQQYELPGGRQFFAPSNDPEVHPEIAAIISGVVGLDNQAVWQSHHYIQETNVAAPSTLTDTQNPNAFPSGPGGGFAPKDIVKAYNLSSIQAQGNNQNVALFQLASYDVNDINTYTTYFGLPPAKLTNVIVGGGSGRGPNAEVTLDIELVLALAPKSHIYVYEGPNTNQGVLDIYNRIASDNLAKQVSISWGLGETLIQPQYLQAENAIFMQMAAQGQTVYAASGDDGAFDNHRQGDSTTLVVDDPACQPYVVGVGGTHLTVNPTTGAYQNETVWNNGPGSAGGGGISSVFPIPAWQTKVSNAASKTHRNVPDVALNADGLSGYAIYFKGQWQIFGGTSCAAPLWAGFTARVNQKLKNLRRPPLGFANPKFYAIGTGSSYKSTFNDVISGDNLFFNALYGYDNASGWGSFNGANLFKQLTQGVAPRATGFMEEKEEQGVEVDAATAESESKEDEVEAELVLVQE